MAGFNGKWKLVSSENGEAFFNAVNASEDFKTHLRALAAEHKANPGVYVEEIKVDPAAKTIQRIVYIKGEVKKDSGVATFGVEAEGKCHGKTAKLTVVQESDTKIVRKEVGADFTSTSTLEVNGDELKLTLVGGGVTAVDKYQRILPLKFEAIQKCMKNRSRPEYSAGPHAVNQVTIMQEDVWNVNLTPFETECKPGALLHEL